MMILLSILIGIIGFTLISYIINKFAAEIATLFCGIMILSLCYMLGSIIIIAFNFKH